MERDKNPNLEILELAVSQLGHLADEMVFLGGCATGLLVTDSAAPPIRVTQDVDAIVQVVSRAEYYRLSDRLRGKGFKEDMGHSAPICRWVTDNITLDVMPTNADILGFGSQWYVPAIEKAEQLELPSGKLIKMVSTPYFLITKLEAYDGRGSGDYLLSHDIEDIVAVLDGRPTIIDELKKSEPELVIELAGRFKALEKDSHFMDAISGHMPTDATSQARVQIVQNTIKAIVELSGSV